MNRPRIPIDIIPGVRSLAGGSDVWFCDIWGVMHNGVAAFAGAVDACRRFRGGGGTVVLLSNAPRPGSAVMRQLDLIGVPRDAYDGVVASGDVTRNLLAGQPHRPVLHIGPDRDLGLFAGLGVVLGTAEAADLVVCSGLTDDTSETPETYRPLLERLASRHLAMICANPDIKVERGDSIVWCAGAIAALYEAIGGTVIYAGKPHLPVYDLAIARAQQLRGQPVDRARVLAIGDGIRTDICGAHAAGLAAIYIASRVHIEGALTPDKLDGLFAGTPYRPLAAMAMLAW